MSKVYHGVAFSYKNFKINVLYNFLVVLWKPLANICFNKGKMYQGKYFQSYRNYIYLTYAVW